MQEQVSSELERAAHDVVEIVSRRQGGSALPANERGELVKGVHSRMQRMLTAVDHVVGGKLAALEQLQEDLEAVRAERGELIARVEDLRGNNARLTALVEEQHGGKLGKLREGAQQKLVSADEAPAPAK